MKNDRTIEQDNSIDILFIDGLEYRHINSKPSNLSFLLPIASILEESEYTFKILNLSTLKEYNNDGFIEELKNHSFKIIGMTTNADNIKFVCEISAIIKKKFPEIPIIVGGPQATYSSEKILSENNIDVVVRHDGEYKLIKLMSYFLQNVGTLNDIKGITFKTKNNDIIFNKDDIFVNIDNLPTPKYEIFTDLKYWIIPETCLYVDFNHFLHKIMQSNNIFIASRGCPYQCTFCVEGNNLNKQRTRCPKKIYNDLRHFIQVTGAKFIFMADDTFTSSPNRVKGLCKIIQKLRKEFDFIWFAEGRVDVLSKHPELLQIMIESGLRKLQLGIESGNPEVLKIYNKRITLDQIRTVVKEASKYDNILLHGNLILGNPGESFTEFLNSIEFAKELIELSGFSMDFSCGYLTPFVGTKIGDNPEKYNLKILSENFEFNTNLFGEPICKPNEMTMAELNSLISYTNKELQAFCNNNIFKLSKEKIDKKMKFYNSYKDRGLYSSFWSKTINVFTQLIRYYVLFDQTSTQKGYELTIKNIDTIKDLIPLRLWEIDYNINNNSYYFTSLKGEIIELYGNNKKYWECASGKNTINDIVKINSPTESNELAFEIFNFYRTLEDNFALMFKKY
jgi:Fe-S oxidoreductase